MSQVLNMCCLRGMRAFPDSSFDSIVTDPPYELGFMGKSWDSRGVAYSVELWSEALRVLKPGGHLLAFSSSRTYHRMTCAIEDAGFEVRDQIMWVYGSGFPKSHNLAGEWEGWGTALKPAHEPICVARKPLAKGHTVATNVLAFGTGAINIDGCRVPHGEQLRAGAGGMPRHDELTPRGREGESSAARRYAEKGATDFAALPGPRGGDEAGRWPANLIHDGSDEVVAMFPDTKGQQGRVTGDEPTANGFSGPVKFGGMLGRIASAEPRVESETSAARFFYCAKTSKADRNAGLEAFTARTETAHRRTNLDTADNAYLRGKTERLNSHPTVKPTDLMAYLCRLVTPPGGTVLDIFAGSGSTGKAAVREGFIFLGFEEDAGYTAIANARIEHEKGKL